MGNGNTVGTRIVAGSGPSTRGEPIGLGTITVRAVGPPLNGVP